MPHGSTLKAHVASVRGKGTSEFNTSAAVCAIARPRGMVRQSRPPPLSTVHLPAGWHHPLRLRPVKAPRTRLDLSSNEGSLVLQPVAHF